MKPLKNRSLEVHATFIGFTSNSAFKNLTLSAKVVYNELLYRYQLSSENSDFWDEDGTPFILYAERHIAEAWGLSIATVERAIQSLKKAGLISIVPQGAMKLNRIYIYDFNEVAKKKSEPSNCGAMNPQNDGHEPSNCGPYTIINTKQHTTSDFPNVKSQRPKGAVSTAKTTKNAAGSLFKTPAITKAEKNAEKWYKERCTQLNGHGFTEKVETALRRFLKTLGETKKSADQISAEGWSVQLEALHRLDDFPDLQADAVYRACNYRSMIISIEQVCKHNNIAVYEEMKPAETVYDSSFENEEVEEF